MPRTPPPQAGAGARGSRHAETDAEPADATPTRTASTPRNSVVFPGPGDLLGKTKGRRTLSELLRLHSEKGCEGRFSADEASRIADVLGQWINSSSSPYEPAEDDFFLPPGSMDDLSPTLTAKKSSLPPQLRPRGRSESASSLGHSPSVGNSSNSRPPSSTGFLGVSS
ncbi:hypothetical protein HYPSUDRAFT_187267 [Hypholoma sublateritium FD-334 SS-4]|uniref:Uncharacterized protein n=1 Tax=Hypholoma sublateritium (strain FD-334 SS-4) TaxID=945553 RepID=A0A0D2MDC5_HYPSF|nr:hypothetical protein HYPSUDRAFT_187267 [Hypholoma sublateritium FD-334 SS-4]